MATAPSEPVSAGEAISRPVIVLLVILGAFVLTRLSRVVLRRVVRYVARRSMVRPSQWWKTRTRYGEHELAGVGENRQRQRIDAAARMLHHLFAVVLWVGVLIAVFHILELNATFFLSSAGFIGAGAAIGGQHKVNDYLTGLSVLLEDRYGVGDEVEIPGPFPNGVRGVVEHIGLVSTRIRDGYSTVHLPHIALVAVRNLSQEPIETRLTIQLPDDLENLEAASRAAETIRELAGSPHLTGVVLVDDVTTATPIAGNEQIEVKVRTAKPLSAAERETLIRRTEERLSAQDS
ncbi:MAG: mechanosensitive ion channel family protein [Actinomycetota bacterium]